MRGRFGFLLALLAAVAGRAQTLRYTVLVGGNRAGVQTAERVPGGWKVHYEYNDRGRGPKVDTVYRLEQGGRPLSAELSGNDYLKSPFREAFGPGGRGVRWESPAEKGESDDRGAFFVSFNGPPFELGLLAGAALAAGDRMRLLPAGVVSCRRVGETSIGAGTLTQVEVSGLGFAPATVWLDSEGTFFAAVDPWGTTIREGSESSIDELLAIQTKSEKRFWAQLSGRCLRTPKRGIVVRNARLFDPATLAAKEGISVVVEGARIRAVGRDADVRAPEGFDSIDAHGQTLMPGLWDMHVHVGDVDGPLNIAAGVTTVRDLGNDIDRAKALQTDWRDGSAIGPRMLLAGLIDGPGPFQGPTKVLVSTPEEARAAVDRYADLGYVQIKIYSSVAPKLVPVIVERAHTRRLRVSGHVPAFMTAEQAVAAGYDEIQHVNFLFLNFFFDRVPDTRTPARFTAVAEGAASLDLSSPRVQTFLDLLVARGTVIDPTVTVFRSMFLARSGSVDPEFAQVADRLPPVVRRGFLAGGLPVPEGKDALYRTSAGKLLDMVAMLHGRGIPIIAGTDGLAGFTLDRELENYVAAGIPAPEVLRIATLGAAHVMKMDRDSGSIAPGKIADMILVDGEPDRRISDICRVRTVIHDGRVIEAAALDAALGITPAP